MGVVTAFLLSSLEALQPFFYVLVELTHLTPPTPLFLPSPNRPFLCPPSPLLPLSACLLTQTLNLLEPRDPVCYVKQFNADTHVSARTNRRTYQLIRAPVQAAGAHAQMRARTHALTACYMVKTWLRSFLGRCSTLYYRSQADAVFTRAASHNQIKSFSL